MRLTAHFSLAEMMKSQTAIRRGFDNTPNPAQIANGVLLAHNVFEPVRKHFGIPFSPSSWFRCFSLNEAIGSDNAISDHPKGMAGDIEIVGVDNYDLACWIRDNCEYKQVILEFYEVGTPSSGWVHVSHDEDEMRMEALTRTKNGWLTGIAK